jgi:cation diffusion facilitator CzcD-associated flavoprotein CzcO
MATQHFDVLIIGAGLSGVGAAHHLLEKCPDLTFTILEGRERMGGTWDLFRYPGIRSDSDMFTLGYSFRPWKSGKSIADGPSIKKYIEDTARESGIDRKIRFNHWVTKVAWSSEKSQWTVEADVKPNGEKAQFTCDFLYLCGGYYSYQSGYTPEFKGRERFRGQVIHPQEWPENLDYAGKRVVVIGSGATAVTLVPSMADKAAHVTMLQRSPTYILSLPDEDKIANLLRRILPAQRAYDLTRWKNVSLSMFMYELSRRRPEIVKRLIRKQLRMFLGKDFDIDKHFSPTYNPWDQRLCLVPNGDLFKAIRRGSASIVTDHIDTFTENGIKLKSGQELEADIIVTATGLNMVPLSGLDFSVDGRHIELGKTMTYKGMMLNDVPNMAYTVGYTNASWTLKADLTALYVCRMLNYMKRNGYRVAVARKNDPSLEEVPLINLASGYVTRVEADLPKQGSKLPWKLYQNYILDKLMLGLGPVNDKPMEYSRGGQSVGKIRA